MFSVCFYIKANLSPQEEYIEKYKHLAIAEMERVNIPASITLAQGLHESAIGKSVLATIANNHFGIKCRGDQWKGATYYKEDDDYDEQGNLTKSCFRAYNSVEECYKDRAEFLLSRPWYAPLFELQKNDYIGWAYGLKAAGYATDPKYPEKLIYTIEKWNLHLYDKVQPVEPIEPPVATREPHIIFSPPVVFAVNDVKVVLAQEGETTMALALRAGVEIDRILKYNERLNLPNQQLLEKERVFIQKKKKEYEKGTEYHIVKEGEDLYAIAQWYGLRLSNLAKRNRMHPSGYPFTGQKIKLKGRKVKKSNKPVWTFKLNPVSPPIKKKNERFHKVEKGETLYMISRKYRVSVEKLLKMNDLNQSTIAIGQLLRVS